MTPVHSLAVPLVFAAAAIAAQPMPADPASVPPAPAKLDVAAAARRSGTSAAGFAMPGLESRPDGGWRLLLPSGEATLDPGRATALGLLGRRLADGPAGRTTVLAQVGGPAADLSAARRLSLARAQAVKAALVAGGLEPTRIDLRALGRIEEGADAVDVQPPPEPAR